MADAVKHTCNNCKIPMEYREISRLSCGHQFCTFCLDQQVYNRIKQPCQICYHLTVPKVQDMPSLVRVQQTDAPQMPSVSKDKGKLWFETYLNLITRLKKVRWGWVWSSSDLEFETNRFDILRKLEFLISTVWYDELW